MGDKRTAETGVLETVRDSGQFYLFLQLCRLLQRHTAAHAQKERDKKNVNTHTHKHSDTILTQDIKSRYMQYTVCKKIDGNDSY